MITTQTGFSKEEAEKLVAQLNADKEDDWTYKVAHCGKWSYIYIFDENNEYVGTM
jgi:hypothetical protein